MGLKPFEHPAFFDAEIDAILALFNGIGLELVAVPAGFAAVFEVEFHGMNRANETTPAVDVTVDQGCTGMRALAGKAIELVAKMSQTIGLAIDLDLGDLAGRPFDIGQLVCDLMPFVTLDKAHQ